MSELRCTLCQGSFNGGIPSRLVPHGMPLNCDAAECLLFCTPDCIAAWAAKMIAFRDRDRGVPTEVTEAPTEPRSVPLPTPPCGVYNTQGEWCLNPRGHAGAHRYPIFNVPTEP